jgi:hypothetical protein
MNKLKSTWTGYDTLEVGIFRAGGKLYAAYYSRLYDSKYYSGSVCAKMTYAASGQNTSLIENTLMSNSS